MKLSGITSINGCILPFAPVKMTITKSDLHSDNSKRSAETGRLLLYPIRRNIHTLELEFLLDEDQKNFLESLIEGGVSSFFVQFDENGDEQRILMYPSDRVTEVQGTKNSRKYRISFSLIEL